MQAIKTHALSNSVIFQKIIKFVFAILQFDKFKTAWTFTSLTKLKIWFKVFENRDIKTANIAIKATKYFFIEMKESVLEVYIY